MPARRLSSYKIQIPPTLKPHELRAADFFGYLRAGLIIQTVDERTAVVRPFVQARTIKGRLVLTAPDVVRLRTFAALLEQAFILTGAGKVQLPPGLRGEIKQLCGLVYAADPLGLPAEVVSARILIWLAQHQRRWETWAHCPGSDSREFWELRSSEISTDVLAFTAALKLPGDFGQLLLHLLLTRYAPVPVAVEPVRAWWQYL